MDTILILVGFVGIIVAVVMLIIRFINKKPKKPLLIAIGVSFVLMITGGIIAGANLTPEEKLAAEERRLEKVKEKEAEKEAKLAAEQLKKEEEEKKKIEKEEEEAKQKEEEERLAVQKEKDELEKEKLEAEKKEKEETEIKKKEEQKQKNEEVEKKNAAEKGKKEPKKEVKKLTIDQKIVKDNKNVDKATLKDGILTIEREPGTLWDENSLFHTVYDLFEVMETAFKDKSVNEVEALVKTSMVDNKGNESVDTVIEFIYTRESFEELNYDKFSNMAYGQQWRILNESDMYLIHPGIYKNLKDKIKDNLISGSMKFPPVE